MSTTITAAVSRITGQPFSLETLELEDPRDNEVLVRIVATGICHSDLHMRNAPDRVPKPIVLGHEGAGVVERVGRSVKKVQPGDHVVITFDSCGACPNCTQGHAAYCQFLRRHAFSGARADGSTALSCNGEVIHSHFFGQSSFAGYSICTERNVVPVDRTLPLSLLGPLGCGIQTGAGAMINSLKVGAGDRVAVLGSGSVGLAGVMAAQVAGAATIVAVDLQANRLALAEQLGATHTLKSTDGGLLSQLQAIAPQGFNAILDTTGHDGLIKQAVAALAAFGVCGLVNTVSGADIHANILDLVRGGRSVRGIHQGDSVPEIFIPKLIELFKQGRFPFDKLIRFYDFADINQAMADMHAGTTIKPVVRISPEP